MINSTMSLVYNSFIFLYRGFLKVFRKIRIDFTPPNVKADGYRAILKNVRPGDMLMRVYGSYLDEIVIPGYYSHGCIVASSTEVIHTSMGNDTEKIDILDFMLNTDGLILLRPKYDKDEEVQEVITWATEQIGKRYDVFFDSTNDDRLFCFELMNRAVRESGSKTAKSFDVSPLNGDRFIDLWDTIIECKDGKVKYH